MALNFLVMMENLSRIYNPWLSAFVVYLWSNKNVAGSHSFLVLTLQLYDPFSCNFAVNCRYYFISSPCSGILGGCCVYFLKNNNSLEVKYTLCCFF